MAIFLVPSFCALDFSRRFDCYTRAALPGPFDGGWGTRVGC